MIKKTRTKNIVSKIIFRRKISFISTLNRRQTGTKVDLTTVGYQLSSQMLMVRQWDQCNVFFVKEIYFSSNIFFRHNIFRSGLFYYRDLEEYVSLDTKNVIQLQVVADLESTEVPYLFLPRKLKNHPNLAPSWLVEVSCSMMLQFFIPSVSNYRRDVYQ